MNTENSHGLFPVSLAQAPPDTKTYMRPGELFWMGRGASCPLGKTQTGRAREAKFILETFMSQVVLEGCIVSIFYISPSPNFMSVSYRVNLPCGGNTAGTWPR